MASTGSLSISTAPTVAVAVAASTATGPGSGSISNNSSSTVNVNGVARRSTISTRRPMTEGFLGKLGGQVKRFKSRHFRIHGQRLEYYKTADPADNRLGVIPITGAKLTVFDKAIYSRDNVFGIQPLKSRRTFVLSASDSVELARWLDTLKPMVDKRQRDKRYGIRNKTHTDSLREGFIETLAQKTGTGMAAGAGAGNNTTSINHWSERYFVLTRDALVYYKEQGAKPAGEIILDSNSSVNAEESTEELCISTDADSAGERIIDDYYLLAINSDKSKHSRYLLRCRDESDRDEWISAIAAVIEQKQEEENGGNISPTAIINNDSTTVINLTNSPRLTGTRGPSSSLTNNNPHAISPLMSPTSPSIKTQTAAEDFEYSRSESEDLSDLSLDSNSDHNSENEEIIKSINNNNTTTATAPAASPTRNTISKSTTSPSISGASGSSQPILDRPLSNTIVSQSNKPVTNDSVINLSVPTNNTVVRLLSADKPAQQYQSDVVSASGYLKKLGQLKSKSTVKQRYYKLIGWVLHYYHSAEEINSRFHIHLIGTISALESESITGFPHSFSLQETFAEKRKYYFIGTDSDDTAEWIALLNSRSSFSSTGLPLRLNPKVHVNMKYSPDERALRDIAISSEPSMTGVVSSNSIHHNRNVSNSALIHHQNHNRNDSEQSTNLQPHTINNRLSTIDSVNSTSAASAAAATGGGAVSVPSLSSGNVASKSEGAKSLIKSAVSKKKRRFIMDGFDLDLTYVTDRIIAMGFPSIGTEALYRNDMVDVQRFLETRHAGHYKVYNLCSERQYDHKAFQNRVLHYGFDDHNTPSFQDIPYFCADVADFLNAHPKNICCIHCKAGKGRTGLMIAIFLLYLGEWRTADEALRYYAFARTQNQKGVTIPSQIRYVHYMEYYMTLSRAGKSLPEPIPLILRKLKFSDKFPSFDYISCNCLSLHMLDLNSKDYPLKLIKSKTDNSVEYIITGNNYTFLSDFQIEFFKKKTFGGKQRVMSFWLHTQFINSTSLKLSKNQIDKVNKDKQANQFELELIFEFDNEYQSKQLIHQQEIMIEAQLMMINGKYMTQIIIPNDSTMVFTKKWFVWLKDEKRANRTGKPDITDYSLQCCEIEKIGFPKPINTIESLQSADIHTLFKFNPYTSILVGKTHDIWANPIYSSSVALNSIVEEKCFSLLTGNPDDSKSIGIHLESGSERQLLLWLEGIKSIYINSGSKPAEIDEAQQLRDKESLTISGSIDDSKSAGNSSNSVAPNLDRKFTSESGDILSSMATANRPASPSGSSSSVFNDSEHQRGSSVVQLSPFHRARTNSTITRRRVISFHQLAQ